VTVLTRRSVVLALEVLAVLLTLATTVEVLGRRRYAVLNARLDLIEAHYQTDAMAHIAAENDLRERITVLEQRPDSSGPPKHLKGRK
jgi:hypothetical protein